MTSLAWGAGVGVEPWEVGQADEVCRAADAKGAELDPIVRGLNPLVV